MTEPLDIDALRAKHVYSDKNNLAECAWCLDPYPCDAVRLCDEVERLRAFETKIMGMLGLPTDDELIRGSGPEPMGILSELPSHPPRDTWERKGPAQ